MSCLIDHLRVDHQIRIIRDFTDLDGRRHRANETGVLQAISLDWAARAIVLAWERDGVRETMRFSLGAKAGPRNGGMREFFEMGEDRSPPRPKSPPRARHVAALQDLPAPSATVITDPAQWEPAVQRIAGLAARSRFTEVETQIRALVVDVGPTGWRLKQLADDLGDLAAAHAGTADRTIYEWLRDRSISLLHAWGSCATSGGEGAVCGREIDVSKHRFEQLDRV